MKKYKLNKDYVDASPTENETESFKDFTQLTHAYDKATKRPKKPLYKDPKAFLALLLIVVVVWIVVEEFRDDKSNLNKSKKEQTDNNREDTSTE